MKFEAVLFEVMRAVMVTMTINYKLTLPGLINSQWKLRYLWLAGALLNDCHQSI